MVVVGSRRWPIKSCRPPVKHKGITATYWTKKETSNAALAEVARWPRKCPIKSSRPLANASLPPIGQKRNNETWQLGNRRNNKDMTFISVELIKVSLDIMNSYL